MIKVIISHDVDHLFAKDHWFRDLVFPKLWIRSSLELLKRNISVREWWLRCVSCFKHDQNHIEELIRFDRENGVHSAFFFGMNQGLGLSYKPDEAKDVIIKTHNAGFEVGVHGICYDTQEGINKEYNQFVETTGMQPCGIRMHYVRFNDNTFQYESNAGYRFDSSEFSKETNGTRKAPYRVQNMWEFPLAIMDVYLPEQFEAMKETTIKIFEECEEKGLEYVSVLFHDYYFCNAYKALYNWYKWLIHYIATSDRYRFVSFTEAINNLKVQD